jgi:hypothetical protein
VARSRGFSVPLARMSRHRPRGTTFPSGIFQVNEVTPLSSQPPDQRGWDSEPQEEPMGQRDGDEGASKCRSVIERIEGESSHG